MSVPSKATIKKHLKTLRKMAEGEDLLVSRIAYEVEHGIRWATESTAGWPSLEDSVLQCAELIRQDVAAIKIRNQPEEAENIHVHISFTSEDLGRYIAALHDHIDALEEHLRTVPVGHKVGESS